MIKNIVLVLGCLVMLPVVGGVHYLWVDRIAYGRAEITSALLRAKFYDPAAHFKFDRACVFPPEAGRDHVLMPAPGYRELNDVFPDTYTHWTLVLADDRQRTVRTLYIQNPKVKFGGELTCGPHIVLDTIEMDGLVTAFATLAPHKGTP